jgi:cyclomaltodextrinase
MRVLFDFVPNHTAISHPYAQDCVKYGHNSHYYNFYQHSNDGKPYSSYYNKGANGLISYFWKGLVNLDYDNAEVQRWMIEAIKYWLIKYDLDGYRFDSMWGVNARTPQFSKKLNTELKSIKPDLLLLAEEKPSDNILYNNGFEAAYDWTRDTAWVSQWSWQVNYNPKKSLTIFNSAELSQRSVLLHNAIFQNTTSGRRLRFIENNDVPRDIAAHTPEQTRMAAALVFALPGIPLVYNGQEIGCKSLPYSARTIFTADRTIQQSDSLGLFLFYKKIIRLHLQYPALIASSINETPLLKSPNMLAFHRWKDNQHLIVIINLDSTPAKASLVYDKNMKQYLQGATSLHDLLTDTVFAIDTNNVLTMQIPMEGYGIRWLLVESKT